MSPQDPRVIYLGGNVLFRSDDRGGTWTAISSDLTRNSKNTQGPGGAPITNEGAGGEVYNTIFYIVESPHEAGTIWVGTDDGLIQITKDGGKTWSNVTPPGLEKTQINAIEVSPHDRATAYIAATGYKWNDNVPHVFKTADYGKSWKAISTGFRANEFVRVVREDPVKRGLLYAGTETGVYVSWDDGVRWQPMQLNLPTVPVTDLRVHADDLVAATQGRAFWILDDITPLRQTSDSIAKTEAYLFAPRSATRVEVPTQSAPATGKNPPNGATIYYALAADPKEKETVILDVLDGSGKTIRHYTSDEVKPIETGPAPGLRLPAKAGLNRLVWDLRTGGVSRIPGVMPNGSVNGYLVAPGRYQVKLTAAGKTFTQPLSIVVDPRSSLTETDFAEQQRFLASLTTRIDEIARAAARVRDARDQVKSLIERTGDGKDAKVVADAGKTLTDKISAWEEQVVQPEAEDVSGRDQLPQPAPRPVHVRAGHDRREQSAGDGCPEGTCRRARFDVGAFRGDAVIDRAGYRGVQYNPEERRHRRRRGPARHDPE